MKTLRDWVFHARHDAGVDLLVEGRHLLRVRVLEDDLIRVSLLKDGAWRLPRTWTIAPEGDLPWEGRSRDDLSGFSCPAHELREGDALEVEAAALRLTIHRPLQLSWAADPEICH